MSGSVRHTRAAVAVVFIAGLLVLTHASLAGATTPGAAPATASDARALLGVSCAGTRDCWAVGWQETGSVTRTLTERWNGSAWKVAASPNVADALQTLLVSVSCPSLSDCWAGGYAEDAAGNETPIAEHWHSGKWSLGVLPEPKGSQSTGLTGISCPTTTRCWAAGATNPGNPGEQSVMEHWKDNRWSIVADSVAGTGATRSVSCVSDTNCWAVGVRSTGRTFAEHWRGRKWSVARTPGAGGFNAIACRRNACMAVGNTDTQFGLAERWNGTRWSVTPTRVPAGATFSYYAGVSCRTSSSCFLVGYYATKAGGDRTIIERWQHSKWSTIKNPEPTGRGRSAMEGVFCGSASVCWAVGLRQKVADVTPPVTLAERWNGVRWSVVRTP